LTYILSLKAAIPEQENFMQVILSVAFQAPSWELEGILLTFLMSFVSFANGYGTGGESCLVLPELT
jgi:hypothetical protein